MNKKKDFCYNLTIKNKAIARNKFIDIINLIKILFIKFQKEIKKWPNYTNSRIYFKKKIKNGAGVLLQFLIFINIFFFANSQYNKKLKNRNLYFSNEISIKILGNEKKNILNPEFTSIPSQIYVNGELSSINNENEIINLPEGENIIRMVWEEQIENCHEMFNGLDNILEVDLSKFDSSKVVTMMDMFSDCTNVQSIIFDNIDTSSVENMMYLFGNCESLISLDLSRINTKSLKNMNNMFYCCKSLISLNLTNFNTSLVTSMSYLFSNCNSIRSLDLSSFQTSNVLFMMNMFEECHELIYLDISNFDTTNVMSINTFFVNCYKLSYINLSNINLENAVYGDYIFYNCTSLEFIDFTNFKESPNFNKSNIFEEASNNFSYCINNIDENPIIIEAINSKPCTIKDCSNIWKIRQKKIISEKNKCVYNCIEDEIYFFTFKNKCYNNCPEGTYLSNEEDKICSIKCSEELPFEKNDECFEECNASEFLSKICTIKNKTVQAKENMINKISNSIIDESINEMLSNVYDGEKEDLIIKDVDERYHITTSYNQNNNIYNNGETIINLGECEDILKEEYNIEDTLILYKMDYYLEEFSIPIVEYEIFNPLTKEKLDLTKCLDKKINIYIPVSIDEENVYKYDPNSNYYKDKCFPSLTECENENILEERKNEFNNNYLSLCEVNCIYKGYDLGTKKVTCECNIKTNFINLSEILNNKNELLFKIIIEDTIIIPSSNIEENYNINSDVNLISSSNLYSDSITNSERQINSDLFTDSNINDDIELIESSIAFINIYTETNTNINSEGDEDINTDEDLELDSNSDINIHSTLYSELIDNIDIIVECLFLDKLTKKCKDIFEFEELISEKYIPLNSKKTIDKVFDLYTKELKNNKLRNKTEIIPGDNIIFQFTTTEEQNYIIENSLYSNISSIDLNKCENILKEKYNIDDNEPLIIMKVDINRNDTISTQIEYEVYNPTNFEKLDLSICKDKNAKISLYPPIDLDSNILNLAKHLKRQGYDLFDSSDNFYNDICSAYNSFNGTDVILKDRKKDFYLPNISICEEECQYEELDLELLKAQCTCNVKTEIKTDNQVKFKPNKIIEDFYKIEKYTNIKIGMCYKKVFNLNIFKKNYGNYIILIIGFIFIVLMGFNLINLRRKVMFFIQKLINGNNLLKLKLNKSENDNNDNKKENLIKSNNLKVKNTNNRINVQDLNTKSSLIESTKKKHKFKNNIIIERDIKSIKKKNKIKKKFNNPTKKKRQAFIKINNSEKGSNSNKEEFIRNKFNNKNKNKINVKGIFISPYSLNQLNIETKEESKSKEKLNDNSKDMKIIDKIIKYFPKEERRKFFTEDELNNFEYDYALKIDFRNYFQFYYSLLKQTHLIIFTFFVRNDYNIFLLKLSSFLISFALFFFMNALFFNDDSMHKIYEDEGKYDLLYQIPKTFYSTIVSQIISSLLELLSLSQDEVIDFKNEGIKNINEKTKNIIKCIRIKCSLFFGAGIILLFGCWYYLSAFCAVYYNTQAPLIKDTFVSFFEGMIYPFILDLIPGIFRIISLRHKIKFLYTVSNITIKIIGIM